MLGLHGERRLCAGDGGVDLGAVADDAGVGAEPFAVGIVVGGDGRDVEAVEGGAVALATVEDGAPRESRLRPFEHEQLEQGAVAVSGDAPLVVVVLLHEGVVAGPLAAGWDLEATSTEGASVRALPRRNVGKTGSEFTPAPMQIPESRQRVRVVGNSALCNRVGGVLGPRFFLLVGQPSACLLAATNRS